jgi:hypothetical protein
MVAPDGFGKGIAPEDIGFVKECCKLSSEVADFSQKAGA